MELNPAKKRKRKRQGSDPDVEEIVQYDLSIPIPEEHLKVVDTSVEAAIMQKVFKLFKFYREHEVHYLPLKNDETEVI